MRLAAVQFNVRHETLTDVDVTDNEALSCIPAVHTPYAIAVSAFHMRLFMEEVGGAKIWPYGMGQATDACFM